MDHTPIIVEEFKGDYKRGAGVNVPFDHFSDSLNIKFTDKGVQSRDGLIFRDTIAVRRMFLFPQTSGDSDRWIILSTGGNFYDSGVSLVSPILTLSAGPNVVTEFSMVTIYNRAYISPHKTFSLNYDLYVYDPSKSATARKAAGLKPATTVTAAASATAGNVEVGAHLFSVAYETDSGFITKPATAVALTITTANFKVDLSNIPTGPAGTAKRQLLATKRIVGYTGNPLDYELFYIPNGTISDNTSTTFTVNFFDADLVESADYLLDQMETIASGFGVGNYEGALTVWRGSIDTISGAPGTVTPGGGVVYVSKFGSPESISTVDGFVQLDANDNEYIRNCVDIRQILYVFKPDRTYAVQGDLSSGVDALPPSRWPITLIDSGIGCASVNGIAKNLDTQGPNQDYAIIMTKPGLQLFNGSYQETQLSYKIDTTWKTIMWNSFTANQIFCDPINKLIYIYYADSTDATGLSPTKFIQVDYQNGLDPQNAKFTMWNFTADVSTSLKQCMGIALGTDGKPVLNIGRADSGTGTINGWFKQSSGTHSDQDNASASVAINSYITTAYFRAKDGGLSHYNMVRSLFVGSGTLAITLIGFVGTTVLNGLTLSTGPVGNIQRIFNYVGEGMAIKLGTNAIGSWFSIYPEFQVFVKKMWASRNV